jgi:hypothetical protein
MPCYCISKTPHNTVRVWITNDVERDVSTTLKVLCLWGDYDKKGENWKSYEFRINVYDAILDLVIKKGYVYSTDVWGY